MWALALAPCSAFLSSDIILRLRSSASWNGAGNAQEGKETERDDGDDACRPMIPHAIRQAAHDFFTDTNRNGRNSSQNDRDHAKR